LGPYLSILMGSGGTSRAGVRTTLRKFAGLEKSRKRDLSVRGIGMERVVGWWRYIEEGSVK